MTHTQVADMPMRKNLDALAQTAATLNSKTDELNQVIADVEHELQDAGVGVTIWLRRLLEESTTERRYRADDDEQRWPIDVTFGWQLGFAKIDGEWRVAARQARIEDSHEGNESFEERPPVPLLKAPRIVRVEAAPLLEALVEALTERMKSYIAGIEQAKALAKDDEGPSFDKITAMLQVKDRTVRNYMFDAAAIAELAKVDVERAEKLIAHLYLHKQISPATADYWAFNETALNLR